MVLLRCFARSVPLAAIIGTERELYPMGSALTKPA
jgi:hypothetical protein